MSRSVILSSARCGACGGTALSYGRHATNVRHTVECHCCGQKVRQRHFGMQAISLGIAAPLVIYAQSHVDGRTLLLVALAIVILTVVVDYLAWRLLPWDPAHRHVTLWDRGS